MTDLNALRRLALIGVLLAIVIGVPSTLAALAASGGDFEAALLFRWAFLGDMFYSYLLLVPLALFLHRRLRERRPWLADLGLAGAFAYIFLGGAGAAILATAGSSLVEAYAAAAPADRPAIATSYELVRDIVYFALWQTLDGFTAGTWMFSVGWLLLADRPRVGRLLVPLGVAGWAFAVITMLDVHSLAVLGAVLLLALAAWLAWVLIDRRRGQRVARPAA